MSDFFERVKQDKIVIIDGGTGTEMEKRGAKMEEKGWSASSTLTAPDLLRGIHKDYIRAGAEVIIANTFSTAKEVLEACDLGDKFEEINAAAVRIALEAKENAAADHEVWVAGSMTAITFEHESKPDYVKLQADFDEQAKIIADSGADFFMLEMMNHIERTQICYEAAAKTGLPVIVGFNVWENHEGEIQLGMHHYPPGRPTLAEGIQALPDDVPMITVMHSLTTDIPAALDVIHANYDGPSGVYAHWGKFVMPSWQFDGMISAQAYADEAEKWAAAGTQLIGGCCGISPVHIQELTKRFR